MHEIDFVITWVNGSDPAWLTERSRYTAEGGDDSAARFRDWGLLRYWFRAVEQYAPWVRKIHFVTWGHLPEWLDTTNPKLHIVNHKDYIPQEYLPTFNSHTIELNLHRIEGLADHFVYFNDDVFLTRYTQPEFFFKNGLPRDGFAIDDIYFAPNSVGWISGSNIATINKHFHAREVVKTHWRKVFSPKNGLKKVVKTAVHVLLQPFFSGLGHWHMTMAFQKSTFERVWEKEYKLLDETCQCRFRGKTNVSPVLLKYWQLVNGCFEPMSTRKGHCYHLTDNMLNEMCEAIQKHSFHVICVNDAGELTNLDASVSQIQNAFQTILPQCCSFEK